MSDATTGRHSQLFIVEKGSKRHVCCHYSKSICGSLAELFIRDSYSGPGWSFRWQCHVEALSLLIEEVQGWISGFISNSANASDCQHFLFQGGLFLLWTFSLKDTAITLFCMPVCYLFRFSFHWHTNIWISASCAKLFYTSRQFIRISQTLVHQRNICGKTVQTDEVITTHDHQRRNLWWLFLLSKKNPSFGPTNLHKNYKISTVLSNSHWCFDTYLCLPED